MNTWRTDIPKPRMFCWSCLPWQLWVRQTDVSFHYILNHKGVAKSVLKGKWGGHRFTEYFGNKKKKRRRRSPFTPTPLFERQDFRRKIWSWHILPQTVSGSSLVLQAQFSFLGTWWAGFSSVGSRVNLLGSFPLPHKLSVPNLCSSDTWTIISILPRTPGPPSFVWLTSPSWVGASPSPGLEALPVFSPGAGLFFIVDSLVSFSRLNFLRGGQTVWFQSVVFVFSTPPRPGTRRRY